MTRRVATRLTRPYRRVAAFALVLIVAAVAAWLVLPASEDDVTQADHYTGTIKWKFSEVKVAQDAICAIFTEDAGLNAGTVAWCWGNRKDGHLGASPKQAWGGYDSLRVGPNLTCAFRDTPHDTAPNKTMQCWGDDPKTEPWCWRIDWQLGRAFCRDNYTTPLNYWDASPNIRHGCWIERHDGPNDDADNDRKIGCINYTEAPRASGETAPNPPAETDKGWIVPDKVKDYKFDFVVTGNSTGVTSPGTNGHFAGTNHTCGLVLDSDRGTDGNQHEGVVECWGTGKAAESPLNMTFKAIEGGWEHNCGIIKDANTNTTSLNEDEDTVHCWGTRTDKKLDAPKNITFKEVSAGRTFSCGIVKDGDPSTTMTGDALEENEDEIRCWGNNDFGQSDPAIGRYKSVSASGALFPGEHPIQRLESYIPTFAGPTGRDYIGRSFACAITIDSDPETDDNQQEGHLSCWGDLKNVQYTHFFQEDPNDLRQDMWNLQFGSALGTPIVPTPTSTPNPRYVTDSISVGRYSNCVLLASGEVSCFGRNLYGEGAPPDGVRAESVSVGFGHTCGISHYGLYGKRPADVDPWYPTNTNVVCWGDNLYGQATPPDGAFKNVSAGGASSCGIKTDGSVVCWGSNGLTNQALITSVPTTKDFEDVKIGYNSRTEEYMDREHACALKTDGSVVCWGDSDAAGVIDSGETTPTAGLKFNSITSGYGSSCGIVKEDAGTFKANEGVCWGKTQVTPTATATWEPSPTPITGQPPNPTNTPVPTPTVVANSVEEFAGQFVTPTPTFKGSLTTDAWVTCGVLAVNWRIQNQTNYPRVLRDADEPYCQGWIQGFGGEVKGSSNKYVDYFPNGPYLEIDTSGYTTCARRANGEVECGGDVVAIEAGPFAGPPPIATVKAGTAAQDSYTCTGQTYNSTSPIGGGRFASASDAYYVSVPPAALENDEFVGINLGGTNDDVTFPNSSSGHIFSGKAYTADVMDVPGCAPPDPALTIKRPIDICIPKAANPGRYVDWRLYEVDNNALTGDWFQGFTDLGGLVCAEVNELPITVAAASKPILTPTPIPVTACEAVDPTTGLTVEKKVGKLDVYVQVPAAALASHERVCLVTNPTTSNVPLTTNAEGATLTVADQYVDLDLRTLANEDIHPINPEALICVNAPIDGPGLNALYHLGDDATTWTKLESPLVNQLPQTTTNDYQTGFACGLASEMSKFASTTLPGNPDIRRMKPNVSSITVSAEDTVRLYVDLWGQDDVLDNTLGAGEVTFDWSIEPRGGSFEELDSDTDDNDDADERAIRFIAPSKPGGYTVRVALAAFECGDDDGKADGCLSEIEVIVRREAPEPEPTEIPMNPAGAIPRVIIGKDGKQYAVFTPEEGGEFSDKKVTVHADPGAVPNGEVIGVRADATGPASNIGQVHHRVTLDGEYFDISAVNLTGERLDGYLLDDPATVCLPLSPNLSRNLSEASVVTIKDDGSFGALTTNLSLTDEGYKLCGKLIEVPARVAAAHLASPDALPSPSATPLIIDPDTGGTAPPNNTAALILLILLGTAIIALSTMLLLPKRRANAT